jgi:hypothetical protein
MTIDVELAAVTTLEEVRDSYHASMHGTLFGHRTRGGNRVYKVVHGTSHTVWTNADSHNNVSVVLADGTAQRLSIPPVPIGTQGSTLGSLFERHTRDFVESSLSLFSHLHTRSLTTRPGNVISNYAQFAHLGEIQALVEGNAQLQAALGGDYLVDPDILVTFEPATDVDLNAGGAALDEAVANHSWLRAANSPLPILHASISCKWTMRRDRAQNTRLEALNLVRNRKGRLPHIAAVTMECDPEILSSLCLGTGDIDCVYHGALHELLDAAEDAASRLSNRVWGQTRESLHRMVHGSRLRDISDLPVDLMI